jgi:signal transduction histidine kinase
MGKEQERSSAVSGPDPWEEIQATLDTLPSDRAAEVNLLADGHSMKILGVRGFTEKLLGQPGEKLRGTSLNKLLPHGVVARGETPFGTHLLKRAGYHGEVTIGCLDGTNRKVAIRVHPFRTEEGHSLIFLRLLDVTEQLRLNRKLRQAHRALRSAYQKLSEQRRSLDEARRAASLSQFAAGLAHELNNPLGVANSNLSSLRTYLRDLADEHFRGKAVPEELEESFAITDDVAGALSRVSGIVLLLDELESKARKSDFELVALLRSSRKKMGIDSLRGPKTLQMQTDSSLILKLLEKIADNARKASPLDGKVRCRIRSVDAGQVEILVEDDGPGVPEAIRDRVFEPFFTTRQPGQGLGLGLFLARRAASLLGGQIDAEDREEGGTRVRVTLPVALPDRDDLSTSYEGMRIGQEFDDLDIPIDISDFE